MIQPTSAQSGRPSDSSAAVILLNWNGWRHTVECLSSLREVTHADFQVVVVDNGSTNDSVDRIAEWAAGEAMRTERVPAGSDADAAVVALRRLREVPPARRLLLVETGENLGFAAGCNVALRASMAAGYAYLNLLNNDTTVEPDYLERLVGALEENPGWVAVGPKILFHHDPALIWYAGGRLRLRRANATHDGFRMPDDGTWVGRRTTEHVSGCCFLAPARTLERFGLLDEDYFFGHEDWAYSTRLRRAGQVVGVDLDARIYHKSGGSWGTGHPVYAYYFNKNRLVILRKEARALDALLGFAFYFATRPLKLIPAALRGRFAEVRAEWRAIRDFFLGRLGEHDRREAARARAEARSAS